MDVPSTYIPADVAVIIAIDVVGTVISVHSIASLFGAFMA